MTVGKICNRDVVFIHQEASVPEVARLMREYHVGDIVVVSEKTGKRVPVGIVTDRDIVLEVIAEGVNVMMRAKGIRRLPVINDDNELSGILSVDDLIELLSEQTSDLAKLIAREQKHEKEKRS
jgi:CBS domain-containing protein